MGATKRVSRDGIGGQDWQLGVSVGRTIPQGSTFVLGGTTVTLTGGKNLRLKGERCEIPRVLVNFTDQELIVVTGWLAAEFTEPVRLEFAPPVSGFGTQYAVSGVSAQPSFVALLRIVLDNDDVVTVEMANGQTTPNMDGTAAFLGAIATGGDRIRVALLDVRPGAGETLQSFFFNSLQVNP